MTSSTEYIAAEIAAVESYTKSMVEMIKSMHREMQEEDERREREYEATLGENRKPKWSSAPSWANWLAMDCMGGWWWSTHRPSYDLFFTYHKWYCHRQRASQAEEYGFWTVIGSRESRPKEFFE